MNLTSATRASTKIVAETMPTMITCCGFNLTASVRMSRLFLTPKKLQKTAPAACANAARGGGCPEAGDEGSAGSDFTVVR